MPLKESWANRGEQVLMDRAITRSTYRVGSEDDYLDYLEITERETNRWFGFTEAAASAKIEENEQPSTGSYSWSMIESERVRKAFDIERIYELKNPTLVGQTPPPVFGSVNFSVNSDSNITSWGFTLNLTTDAPSGIMWRLGAMNGVGTILYTAWEDTTSQSTSVNVNSPWFAGGAGNFHKYIIVEARSFRILQTGRYESGTSSRAYSQPRPTVTQITDAHWSPLGYNGISSTPNVSMPFNLTINTGQTAATIFTFIQENNGSWRVQSGWTNRGNSPATISNLNGISHNFGGSFGVRKLLQINAYPAVILDGITYLGNQSSSSSPAKIYVSM
jgi:hypothetical protein